MIKTIILFFLFISHIFATLNYRYLYYQHKNVYSKYILIKEINKSIYEGSFYFQDNNNICIKPISIIINNHTSYYKKYTILIHELTHYLQCIYSIKHNTVYSSITNNIPNKSIIHFINNTYNESYLKEEYEAYYYQYNHKEFHDLERHVLFL